MTELGDFTHTWLGVSSLIIFIVGYYFITKEDIYNLNKAKPALFMGTFLYLLIGFYFVVNGIDTEILHIETKELILEISEIFFFLLVAMTFIEVMVGRGVFEVLKYKLLSKGYSYKQLFWIIGISAFFLSPIADNLTTALVLATTLATISKSKEFLVPSAVNIVVGANFGGTWSPFGDITTLMAWTAEKGMFSDFLLLFPSAFIGWAITAYMLSFFIPKGVPTINIDEEVATLKPGAMGVVYLGLFTIFMAVICQQFLQIPPMWGMMYGLALLQLFSYKTKKLHEQRGFNIYKNIKRTEMDTLLFFFGILSAVGALSFIGFLDYIVKYYDLVGIMIGNISIGFVSAIIDNVPVMSAVLKSDIDMGLNGWLLLTLAVGIGGSLISFGSAAGIGVMGKLRGVYTFSSHMKFLPIVLIGYIVSIGVFCIQCSLFLK